jgi:hypothetical protein
MAKPQSVKQHNKASEVPETVAPTPESSPTVDETAPVASQPLTNQPGTSTAKKDSARPKKQVSAKNGSLLPSAYKLEQLKAAVTAAGSTDKLLLILHHVEKAGGRAEVTESIEAYRVLKTVLDK